MILLGAIFSNHNLDNTIYAQFWGMSHSQAVKPFKKDFDSEQLLVNKGQKALNEAPLQIFHVFIVPMTPVLRSWVKEQTFSREMRTNPETVNLIDQSVLLSKLPLLEKY